MIPAIGFASEKDLCKLKELYTVCFPEDPGEYWDWFFQKTFSEENVLVLREGEEILSTLQMLPCVLSHGESTFSAHYIYAACTLPRARGKGWMGALLSEAAAIGRARGQQFSVLITREDSLLRFYDRYGYTVPALVTRKKSHKRSLLSGERVRRIEENDLPRIDRTYREEGRALLLANRDERLWKNHLEQYADSAFLLENDDAVKAYCFMDERGVMEAVGPGKERLVGFLCPEGMVWNSLPHGESVPMGCLRPLTALAARTAEEAPFYLNLMYN